jgi:hypothetical protein
MTHDDGIGCHECFPASAEDAWAARSRLTITKELVDESHFMVSLRACAACSQLFVSVFCERIDWQQGNDPQASWLIPVSAEEAQSLTGLDEHETEAAICRISPQRRFLESYLPSDGARDTRWQVGPWWRLPPHD